METIVLIGGLYNIGFALFHLAFWKIFKWNDELKKLSFANKAILS